MPENHLFIHKSMHLFNVSIICMSVIIIILSLTSTWYTHVYI